MIYVVGVCGEQSLYLSLTGDLFFSMSSYRWASDVVTCDVHGFNFTLPNLYGTKYTQCTMNRVEMSVDKLPWK